MRTHIKIVGVVNLMYSALGVLGAAVVAAGSAPGGDPRIFRVDGSEIALRRDTASHLYISSQPLPESDQL